MKKILCLLICLFVAGCQQPAPAPAPLILEDRSHPEITIIYGSEDVLRNIIVRNKIMNKSGKLPKFTVTVENRIQQALPLEYKVSWKDASGFPINTATTAWHRLNMPQNAEKAIVNMAKTTDAARAQFLIRFATDVEILVPVPVLIPIDEIY